MREVEVLIVGAGPAGSTVAYELSRSGHDVLVIEEHPNVGYPVQCAGLVSQRVLDLAGSSVMVRGPVHGATVFAPSLRSVSFKAAEPRAFVIDRAGLDIYLADRAARAGARFETGVKFDRRVGAGTGSASIVRLVGLDGKEEEVFAKLVIGTDGVASAVARAFRLRRPVEILPAFEAEFGDSPGDPDQVEVYLGNELSPGLFGWWIPDGHGGARVGVAVRAGEVSARTYFDRLLRHLEKRFGAPFRSPVNYVVSGVPIGTVPRTQGPGVLLVGDAAAQVKPLSGGGIFMGMRCAQIAAEVAHRSLDPRDGSAGSLSEYETAWRAELGEEIAKALYLRKLFVRLSDADLERIIEALQGSEMKASIVAFGDIDFPTHVARDLLRQSPSLVRLFPKALSALLAPGPPRLAELDPGPRRQTK
ncbi:MAG: NAD(P)/FAD-dependent oxidoreductase [Thermoplasmata archaeon]|nr:NAD(P)/FAD-dependent oxidoreductase [Thermoplasmata archaeon]